MTRDGLRGKALSRLEEYFSRLMVTQFCSVPLAVAFFRSLNSVLM